MTDMTEIVKKVRLDAWKKTLRGWRLTGERSDPRRPMAADGRMQFIRQSLRLFKAGLLRCPQNDCFLKLCRQ